MIGVGWSGGGSRGGAGRDVLRGLAGDVREWAAEQARVGVQDGLAGLREAIGRRPDPARLHAKRVRRAQRSVGVRSVAAGGLAWVTATVGAVPGIELGEVAWGGATAVAAVGAVRAGRRLVELRRVPVPPARPRLPAGPRRPPRGSPARRPLDRLTERERALAGLLVHLGAAADEPRAVAGHAAAALRELGARASAVELARRGAPAESAAGLDAAVAGLVGQLETGVAGYDALVVAAAEAVAADATLHARDPVLLARLAEATDSLAGLAAGLHEITR